MLISTFFLVLNLAEYLSTEHGLLLICGMALEFCTSTDGVVVIGVAPKPSIQRKSSIIFTSTVH